MFENYLTHCLKAGVDLDFLPLRKISITGLAADKNYTELSKLEMSITRVKFKI